MMQSHLWQGFWQLLSESQMEETLSFRNTTTTERGSLGFVLFTATYFMELRVTGLRQLPAGWPPTEQELVKMFRVFQATAGRYVWQPSETS